MNLQMRYLNPDMSLVMTLKKEMNLEIRFKRRNGCGLTFERGNESGNYISKPRYELGDDI